MTPLDHTPCDCGDDGPRCDDCGQRMCCGPEMVGCDFKSHCEECAHGCVLCVKEMAAS
jgi:hypothetical protein